MLHPVEAYGEGFAENLLEQFIIPLVQGPSLKIKSQNAVGTLCVVVHLECKDVGMIYVLCPAENGFYMSSFLSLTLAKFCTCLLSMRHWCINVMQSVKVYSTDPAYHRRKCADKL